VIVAFVADEFRVRPEGTVPVRVAVHAPERASPGQTHVFPDRPPLVERVAAVEFVGYGYASKPFGKITELIDSAESTWSEFVATLLWSVKAVAAGVD
jgi:hypothetical protein